jgi:hypothetical protein
LFYVRSRERLRLTRYLVRRLRAQFAVLPIVVGRWGETEGSASAAERLVGVGASRVVFTLADARARILSLVVPEQKSETVASATPARGVGALAASPKEGGPRNCP